LREKSTEILTWKQNNRAVATFKSLIDITKAESGLSNNINNCVETTKYGIYVFERRNF
jgi:hypothetical protein